jgi:hypothetical protein
MTSKKHDDEPITVRIDLPLPTDVAGTIIKMFGLTYPHTMIADDEHTWRHERKLVLKIDPADRHNNAKAMKKYREIRDNADGWIGWTTELGPNGVGMAPHEMLAKSWVDLAKKGFALIELRDSTSAKQLSGESSTGNHGDMSLQS